MLGLLSLNYQRGRMIRKLKHQKSHKKYIFFQILYICLIFCFSYRFVPKILKDNIIIAQIGLMGASNQKPETQNQVPAFGGRIIQVLNPDLAQKIQPFTDFIISPTMQVIKQAKEQVQITIFSILDYSLRKETLPIVNHHVGIKIKQCKIRDCILRITKIFPESPCEKLGINSDEYIVGLAEAEYDNLKGFADALRNLISKRCEIITMAVCSPNGKTRIMTVPLTLLDEWKQYNKGILGCQLAEGWMNRFKTRTKKQDDSQVTEPSVSQSSHIPKLAEILTKMTQEHIKEQINSNVNQLKRQEEQNCQESQQIQRKCDELLNIKGGVIQRNFKGLLKSEYLDDASTICKCKIYNKNCQKCFLLKDNNAYFFNKKINRIIIVPNNQMFSTSD